MEGILNPNLTFNRIDITGRPCSTSIVWIKVMDMKMLQQKVQTPVCVRRVAQRSRIVPRAAASTSQDELGFKMMRRGVKEAANETVLSPRFYTTDFDETEEMFS